MPAAALTPKNTSSGPSSMASFAASAAPDSTPWVCARGLASGGCGIARVQTGDGAGEVLRVEGLQIVNAFADADGIDRQTEPLGDGHQNAAARRAVELGHHQAGDARDLLEGLHLGKRVLPGGGIEHQNHAGSRLRIELL